MKTRITCPLSSLFLLTLTSVVSFSQVKPPIVEIPFDFDRNEIILQVKINGKGPFNMMLDTSTDPSTIELNTARELGLKLIPLGSPPVGGGTAPRMVYGVYLPSIEVGGEVGGLAANNVEAVAIDMSKISERLGKLLHGVIGHSVLNGRIVQIDYPHRVVRFYSKSPFAGTPKQPNTA